MAYETFGLPADLKLGQVNLENTSQEQQAAILAAAPTTLTIRKLQRRLVKLIVRRQRLHRGRTAEDRARMRWYQARHRARITGKPEVWRDAMGEKTAVEPDDDPPWGNRAARRPKRPPAITPLTKEELDMHKNGPSTIPILAELATLVHRQPHHHPGVRVYLQKAVSDLRKLELHQEWKNATPRPDKNTTL